MDEGAGVVACVCKGHPTRAETVQQSAQKLKAKKFKANKQVRIQV